MEKGRCAVEVPGQEARVAGRTRSTFPSSFKGSLGKVHCEAEEPRQIRTQGEIPTIVQKVSVLWDHVPSDYLFERMTASYQICVLQRKRHASKTQRSGSETGLHHKAV